MIQQIKGNSCLKPYLCKKIEDEGIFVEIDGQLREEQYGIIKVDDYYRGLHLKITPKAIDFLVAVDCECNAFVLYLLELKNVKNPKYLIISDIHEKFKNTIEDFLSQRFAEIFLSDQYKYKDIKLYLVSDAYGISGKYKTHEQYKKIMDKVNKRDSLKIDRSLGSKLYRFRNRIVKIDYDIPPNPIIRRMI